MNTGNMWHVISRLFLNGLLKSKYFIGCSGYYYSYWKNRFYPEGLAAKNWLAYYSSVFNTVELNGTFYRTPTLASLKKYYAQTPEEFKFSVKVSKYITHILRLNESKQSILDFQHLIMEGLGDKLLHFLFQLPPSFKYTPENLGLVVDNVPHNNENVIEFRHASWWDEVVRKELKKAKLTFCNVDFPELASPFMQTSSMFYLRLHGNPELFKSSYSVKQLTDFYKNFPPGCKQYSVYFNNTYYEAGYTNARELKKIIDTLDAA